jgi:FkbM family methyltransferase
MSIKSLLFGKKAYQPLFRRLLSISLEGMNIGTGGGNLENTGEKFAIGYALKGRQDPIVFDVGAQGGDYLSEVLKAAEGNAVIHAFEPNSKDHDVLERSFGHRARIVKSALGDKNGEAVLYFPSGVSGLSSLHGGDERFTLSEKVKIETIDSYCKRQDIKAIDLLKLDVEGHELSCLKGAVGMLPNIRAIQFEMGIASRDSKTYFKDIQTVLSGYTIYRILRDGLEEIKTADKLSETLFTTNYLAEKR